MSGSSSVHVGETGEKLNEGQAEGKVVQRSLHGGKWPLKKEKKPARLTMKISADIICEGLSVLSLW